MLTIKALPRKPYRNLHRCKFKNTEPSGLNWIPNPAERLILEKNNFQCAACQLRSRPHLNCASGFIEITQDDQGNPLTLCSMCMQSQHMGRPVSHSYNHGLIIYCPALTQGELIKLCQSIFVAKFRKSDFEESANILWSAINRELVRPVNTVFGELGDGTIQKFVSIYNELTPQLLKAEKELFCALRYLPNEVFYQEQIQYWSKTGLNDFPPSPQKEVAA